MLSICGRVLSVSAEQPGVRARNRALIEREILRAGREQLAEVGAAALSLRAVARDLGMVSSAVYRYVESRDELLTRLIIEAYDSLGDAADAALDRVAGGSARERFLVLCRTIRAWALEHPHEYALIYGSPVPQYRAPAERTNRAGNRIPEHFVAILTEEPDLLPARHPAAMAADAAALRALIDREPALASMQVRPEGLARGYAAWALVFGALGAELFEQFGPDGIPDPAAHFEVAAALAAELVFGPEQ